MKSWKAMYPQGYHHNGFMAALVLRFMLHVQVEGGRVGTKPLLVITGRAQDTLFS